MAQASNTARTLDGEEVARFARLAGQWWDERGPFRPLHRINPLRLTYIRDQLCRRFGRDAKGPASLAGFKRARHRLRRRARVRAFGAARR